MDFSEFTLNERTKMFNERIDTSLIISREILNFENIEQTLHTMNLELPFSIPPLILDENIYGGIISLSNDDDKGKWLRTMYRTYMEGGEVVYKRINNNQFEVQIKFKKL